MSDDVPMACGDEFGMGDMQDRLKYYIGKEIIYKEVSRND